MTAISVSQDELPKLPPRPPDSHKGDYGRAVLIGGSRGMTGAIGLAGMATLRSGAGLVTLAVPAACQDIVASYEPSYMTIGLPCDQAGHLVYAAHQRLEDLLANANCIACGPGLGRSDGLTEVVEWLYESLEVPLVIDADALNALAAKPDSLDRPGGPRILTPHPGEFRRLANAVSLTAEDPADQAVELASECGIVVVLKGYHTLITDGHKTARNETGNPGMATGGAGDVLTGVITALVCQGLSPFEAAHLGVHVHGLAGDLAAAQFGQVSLIARDLIDFLPRAFQSHAGT